MLGLLILILALFIIGALFSFEALIIVAAVAAVIWFFGAILGAGFGWGFDRRRP